LSNMMYSKLLLAACLGFAIACCLTQVAMIVGINSKLGTRSQFSSLRRDLFGIFQEHRRLYPASNLRVAFIVSLVLLVASSSGFVLIHNLSR
jgi:hypothetical protein